jgi:hypothetical protein
MRLAVPHRREIAAMALDLSRRLRALEEGTIRARAAGRAVAALPPDDAAAMIAELVARAGIDPAPVAAVGQALLDPAGSIGYGQLADIYLAACQQALEQVRSLFLSPPPQRAWEEPYDKPDPRIAHLTLGHKKSLARRHRDPDLLARLAAEGEPVVVRELVRNPQLTEPFAVRIAARRPCRPETLRCLFEERRWRTRPAVALALARNPYLETEISLKLLPGLPARELGAISRDGSLHPLVRAVAGKLEGERRRKGRRKGAGSTG